MIFEILLILFLVAQLVAGWFLYGKLKNSYLFNPPEFVAGELLAVEPDQTPQKILEQINRVGQALAMVGASVEKIPVRTLNTIQGSVNTTTGKLGELITFIELQRTYDRLMPVGGIIDFIGVRFPNGDDPGALDFIDVKTGDKAVLNADQKKFRAFIADSKEHICFKVVKVDITK